MSLKDKIKKAKKFLKDAESKFYKELTKPLTPTEKKLAKVVEAQSDVLKPFLTDKDPFSVEDELKLAKKLKKKKECKHEFVVVDFKKGLLKCKHCGLKITTHDLGRQLGTRLIEKKAGLDIERILSI